MSNGFLSQDEINALLMGSINEDNNSVNEKDEILTDIEKDLLGEVGNISMGSASTTLYQLVNKKVNITTPVVTVTTLNEIKQSFEIPNILLDVEYTSGIVGRNMLIMKVTDAAVIANLMMGGNGKVENPKLSELEVSAVAEAMNQMIGSAATSMATMFMREVNISPPVSKIWENVEQNLSNDIDGNEKVVKVSFALNISDVLNSSIMQVLPITTAKKIVSIMMGEEEVSDTSAYIESSMAGSKAATMPIKEKEISTAPTPAPTPTPTPVQRSEYIAKEEPKVEVQKAQFGQLAPRESVEAHRNIDLILDVPLQISVVLGRTKKNIRDILNLGTGSLIELDKLADEPVEVLVNGKTIAKGEVVVVDENFGVRITNIVSGDERVRSLR